MGSAGLACCLGPSLKICIASLSPKTRPDAFLSCPGTFTCQHFPLQRQAAPPLRSFPRARCMDCIPEGLRPQRNLMPWRGAAWRYENGGGRGNYTCTPSSLLSLSFLRVSRIIMQGRCPAVWSVENGTELEWRSRARTEQHIISFIH